MASTHITNAHSSYVHRQSLSLESFIYVEKVADVLGCQKQNKKTQLQYIYKEFLCSCDKTFWLSNESYIKAFQYQQCDYLLAPFAERLVIVDEP